MSELEESVLTIDQRRKRSMSMRRNKEKLKRARERAQRRQAPEGNIKKRAQKLARQMVRARVAGDRGKNYAELSTSEKIAVDKLIDSPEKVKLIRKMAERLIPKIRRMEQERLMSFTKGHQLKNLGQPEGNHTVNEDINKLFNEYFSSSGTPEGGRATVGGPISNSGARIKDKKKDDKKDKDDKNGDGNPIKQFGKFQQNEEKILEALENKAVKHEIDFSVLAEVFTRGLEAYPENCRVTLEQYAFARVNSFINKGKTYFNEDADLQEAEVKNHYYVTYNSQEKGNKLLHPKKKPFTSMTDAKRHIEKIAPGHPERKNLGRIHTVNVATGRITSITNYDGNSAGYPSTPGIGDSKELHQLKEGYEEDVSEGIVDKIKGAVRREKAKDLPLLQTRRDYAMGKGGEAYNKGEIRKGNQYMAYAERDRKKKGDPSTNPMGTYRTKTSDYVKEYQEGYEEDAELQESGDEKHVVIVNYGRGVQALWPSTAEPKAYSKKEADEIVDKHTRKPGSVSYGHMVSSYHTKPLHQAHDYVLGDAYRSVKKLQRDHGIHEDCASDERVNKLKTVVNKLKNAHKSEKAHDKALGESASRANLDSFADAKKNLAKLKNDEAHGKDPVSDRKPKVPSLQKQWEKEDRETVKHHQAEYIKHRDAYREHADAYHSIEQDPENHGFENKEQAHGALEELQSIMDHHGAHMNRHHELMHYHNSGLAKPMKLKEETEDLTELSPSTMKSYSGKAFNQYVNATVSGKWGEHGKEHDQGMKRFRGSELADKKLKGTAKVNANESAPEIGKESEEGEGTKSRRGIQTVPRKDKDRKNSGEATKHQEVVKKILEQKLGNNKSAPKNREVGTDSLKKVYKDDTPFAEEAKTSDRKPVVVPAYTKTDAEGKVISVPAKTHLRKTSKVIVGDGNNSDGK